MAADATLWEPRAAGIAYRLAGSGTVGKGAELPSHASTVAGRAGGATAAMAAAKPANDVAVDRAALEEQVR